MIGESQSIYLPNSLEDLGLPFVISRISHHFGYALAGVLSLFFFLISPRSKQREFWVLIASILVAVTIFSISRKGLVLRDAPVFGLVMVFPYAGLVAVLYERLSRLTTRRAELMRATCLAVLALWPLGLTRALGSSDAETETQVDIVTPRCLVKEHRRSSSCQIPIRSRK